MGVRVRSRGGGRGGGFVSVGPENQGLSDLRGEVALEVFDCWDGGDLLLCFLWDVHLLGVH